MDSFHHHVTVKYIHLYTSNLNRLIYSFQCIHENLRNGKNVLQNEYDTFKSETTQNTAYVFEINM